MTLGLRPQLNPEVFRWALPFLKVAAKNQRGSSMIPDSHLLSSLITANQTQLLSECSRYVSRSPQVFPILFLLLVTARLMPPDLDGQAAPITRKEILQWLEASGPRMGLNGRLRTGLAGARAILRAPARRMRFACGQIWTLNHDRFQALRL